MKVTDEQIIKVLHNAWRNAPGQYIVDAYLTSGDVAGALKISLPQACRRLKALRDKSDKIKGILHGGAWLWVYNGELKNDKNTADRYEIP